MLLGVGVDVFGMQPAVISAEFLEFMYCCHRFIGLHPLLGSNHPLKGQ